MTYTPSLLMDRPFYSSTAPRLATAAWTGLRAGHLQYRSARSNAVSEQLQIRFSPRGDCTLVHLVGELDILTFDLAYRTLLGLLAQQKGSRLVLDLSKLRFADARGLRALQSASINAAENGGWVRLACVGERMRRVLAIFDVANRLPAYDTVAAAIAGNATCPAPGQE
jgi:anti-sigma B factor antagonist